MATNPEPLSLYHSGVLEVPTLTAESEARMRAYLAARPRARHGTHRYALEDFGLDRARLRARYAAYMARYDVPEE